MRGKGEHAIYKRTDGLWAAAIELPARDGKRRRRVVTAKLKADVLAKLTAETARLAKAGDIPTANMTVEQWFEYWLRDIAPKEVRPKTMGNYRSFTKNHILPAIGAVRLNKLTPAHVRKVDDAVAEKLSSTSAATAHRIMSSSFATAEREGRIARNPAELVKAPRIAPTKLEVLDLEEFVRLIGLFGNGTERVLWATYLLTGARRGETLGLQWDRVANELDLCWQLQRHSEEAIAKAPADFEYERLSGGLYLTRPKSKAGTRVVPLVQPLAGILATWRTLAPVNPYGLLFARENGEPFDPDYISKTWPRILKEAGITKHVRLHDLRHTAVDMMYYAKVPDALIQEIVGHSTRAMTQAYRSRGNRPQLENAMLQFSSLLAIEPVAGGEVGGVDDLDG